MLGSPIALIALSALIASSPRHQVFWIIVGAFAVAMIPLAGALAWFYAALLKQPQNRQGGH